jgi:hypothetical protein
MFCVKYDKIRNIVLQNIQTESEKLRGYLRNEGFFFMIVDQIWKQTCFTFQAHNIINLEKSGFQKCITTPNQTFIALDINADVISFNNWMLISNKQIVVQSLENRIHENLRFVKLPLHVYKDIYKSGDIESQSRFVLSECAKLDIQMDLDGAAGSSCIVTSDLYHSIQCNDIFARKSTIPSILGQPLAAFSSIIIFSKYKITSHKTTITHDRVRIYGGS